ncbi:hypothetical protein [Thermocatellispora tengchongensis]|uniref:hypothetical protein n=1 Tax=Thermocatellispora tengchongensis TaxID=1073253 RepID=UPI003638CC42
MRPVSLRVKLTVAVVLLVTLAAAVISVISVIVLRDRLFGRVDDQIRRTTETLRRDMRDERPAPDGRLRVYVPSDVLVLRLGADGAVVARSRNVDPRLEAALPKPVPEGGFTVGDGGCSPATAWWSPCRWPASRRPSVRWPGWTRWWRWRSWPWWPRRAPSSYAAACDPSPRSRRRPGSSPPATCPAGWRSPSRGRACRVPRWAGSPGR